MKTPRPKTRHLLLICLLSAIGCDHAEIETSTAETKTVTVKTEPAAPVEQITTTLLSDTPELETITDVQHAVSNAENSDRAVLFVHVDWAVMQFQKARFDQFAVEYHRAHPKDNLLFHYVDCTPVTHGYAPLRELKGWKELENPPGASLIHGKGEVVWLRKGRVLQVQPILNYGSTADLISETNRLLPGKNSE